MIGDVIARHLALIGSLSGEDLAALRSLDGRTRDLDRGEDVLKEGERPHESVIVLTGMLQRYKIMPQGNRQIHSFYLPGETPSLEAIPMEMMDNRLGAVAPSRVGIVEHAELCRVMDERPHVRTLIWRETLVQAAIVREWLMRNSQMLAHAQMGHVFCEVMTRAKAHGLADEGTCDLPITQEHMADALGMTAVHVNRTLQILRAGGLVEFGGGKLTINDLTRLAELSDFNPIYLHLH